MTIKTTLIHNGATAKGIELTQKLLAENDLTTSDIKNRVICIDIPERISQIQDFLSRDEFTFYALDKHTSIDINEHIDNVILLEEK